MPARRCTAVRLVRVIEHQASGAACDLSSSGTGEVQVAGFAALDPVTAYRLWALRAQVFVVEQDCPYLDLDGRDLEPGTRHLWVEREGVPVAVLRLLDDGAAARIGRVATHVRHRGGGLAGVLVRRAMDLAGERDIAIDAQSHLAEWYAGFGFVPSGPGFLEDGIPHTPMVRRGPARPSGSAGPSGA